MKWTLFAGLIGIGLVASSAAHAQSQGTRMAPAKGWHDNLETAKAIARKTGKPLLVIFRCDP